MGGRSAILVITPEMGLLAILRSPGCQCLIGMTGIPTNPLTSQLVECGSIESDLLDHHCLASIIILLWQGTLCTVSTLVWEAGLFMFPLCTYTLT